MPWAKAQDVAAEHALHHRDRERERQRAKRERERRGRGGGGGERKRMRKGGGAWGNDCVCVKIQGGEDP